MIEAFPAPDIICPPTDPAGGKAKGRAKSGTATGRGDPIGSTGTSVGPEGKRITFDGKGAAAGACDVSPCANGLTCGAAPAALGN